MSGEDKATAALLCFSGLIIDFGLIFAHDGHDLMRPRGGEYPGIAKGLNRSMLHEYSSADGEASGTVEIQHDLPSGQVLTAALSMSQSDETSVPPRPPLTQYICLSVPMTVFSTRQQFSAKHSIRPMILILRMPSIASCVCAAFPSAETVGTGKAVMVRILSQRNDLISEISLLP